MFANYGRLLCCLFFSIFLATNLTAAPVEGFVQSLGASTNLPGGTVTILETGQVLTPDKDGKFKTDIPAGT